MILTVLNKLKIIETHSIGWWNEKNSLSFLRVSLGLIFIWFGVLKFFPGLSSAEAIAGKTVLKLTFGYIVPSVSMPLLALLECMIGMGLLLKKFVPLILIFLYIQLLGTMSPLILFPELTFSDSIFVPTLLGQYIIKNIVLLSAAIVIGATSKGRVTLTDNK
ncbi:doxx family protein [Gramella sp. AN32]|uniref:Doxx family protein n=1 Tax=Christiangramia antarctica TaxID=2058158 RepID=A0ABW5X4J5_9FLAO|nr:doxx family protein [Gramella sp. AN32]MCM4158120.1 hypothetical protein [Gramella sp. AN32]